MVFIVMLVHCRHIYQCRSHIRFWHEGDIVTFHRFYELFSHTVSLWIAYCCVVHGSRDSVHSRTSEFHALYKPNCFPSATGLIFLLTSYRTTFPLHPASHPIPTACRNHLFWNPCLWLLCRSSSTQTSPAAFRYHHSLTLSHLNTSATRFLATATLPLCSRYRHFGLSCSSNRRFSLIT